ncbi:hypothetical protein [Sulfitobacter sp. 1A15299]|uniref:hypothetical protein n=1 Tax=Sulfitobacter sp. 1A15299 TaxID=3368598 RepID=UPI00374A66AB
MTALDAAQHGGRIYREGGPAILQRDADQLDIDIIRTAERACERDIMLDDSDDIAGHLKADDLKVIWKRSTILLFCCYLTNETFFVNSHQ